MGCDLPLGDRGFYEAQSFLMGPFIAISLIIYFPLYVDLVSSDILFGFQLSCFVMAYCVNFCEVVGVFISKVSYLGVFHISLLVLFGFVVHLC